MYRRSNNLYNIIPYYVQLLLPENSPLRAEWRSCWCPSYSYNQHIGLASSFVAHQDQQTTSLHYRHARLLQTLRILGATNKCMLYYWQDIKEVKISYSITMKEKMPIFVSRLKVLKNAGCFRNTRIRRDYEKTIIIFDSYNVSLLSIEGEKVCLLSISCLRR